MSLQTETIVKRIDVLLNASLPTDTEANIYAATVQKYQGALTLVTALYGATSHQAHTLLNIDADVRRYGGSRSENFS